MHFRVGVRSGFGLTITVESNGAVASVCPGLSSAMQSIIAARMLVATRYQTATGKRCFT
jgi:hypothetical protein